MINFLPCVMDVEEGKLEEEVDDKPGTTIGTKFSVLQLCPDPVFSEMCFLTVDPLVRLSVFIAKSFLSDKIAGVFSRTVKVKNTSSYRFHWNSSLFC